MSSRPRNEWFNSVGGIERTEIDALVLERAQVQFAPGFDERNSTTYVLRPVQTDHRIDSSVVDIERQEAPGVEASTHDQLFPFRVKTSVLEIRIVLVRPEPVNRVVRHILPQHVARGSSALLDGVVPVLHSLLAPAHG